MGQEAQEFLAIGPQPGPQASLLSCPCDEIMYGGARGGGKSYGMLLDWTAHEARYGRLAKGILFRRTMPELEDLMSKAEGIFPAFGGAFRSQRKTWVFPTGATLKFRYLDKDSDADNYQGHEYNWMGFDEIGNWPSFAPLDRLRSCLRSAEGVKVRMVLSCNPGGVGHNWVKARYIDPTPAMTPRKTEGGWAVFIPAKVQDNLILMANDPGYVDRIRQSGPDWLVRAWLNGDWDIVAGGMFDDLWRQDVHVLAPFQVPATWRIDRSFDWGSSKPFSVGWWAESDGTEAVMANGVRRSFPRGSLFHVAEWYGWNGEPDTGCRMIAADVAKKIVEMQKAMFPLRTVHPGPADSSIYDAENGVCIADDMARAGVRWVPADKSPGSRKNGAERIRKYLKAALSSPMEEPGLFVFDTCRHFLRTFPTLPRSRVILDDVDTKAEDHPYDMTRYRVLGVKRTASAVQQTGGWAKK
ncbi:phage terminase large subunit [Fundidesulfovibrio butyratiphilus]